jgi:uncharacterized protein (TIGR00251 family)
MIELTAHPQGTILCVHAQPGAKRNGIIGERAGAVRVAVTAAPEKGKANAAIQDVLADALGLRPARIAMLSGETSRQKRFLIADVTPDELRAKLQSLLPNPDPTLPLN